jgi:carboxymethylenebutenolidase
VTVTAGRAGPRRYVGEFCPSERSGSSRREVTPVERKQTSEYPRELLDLFHEYQHGDITRRAFFDGAAKFAVGGLTVTAIWESLKPNYAWAQQVPKDDMRITTSYETVPSPDGNGSIKGYLARPAWAAGKLPAVVVIHENRGVNPYIEDVARRLAVLDFVAFAPDGLTSVGGYAGDDEKAAAAFRTVDGAKMTEDFVASAKWLRARPESSGKLGAVGFCFGGGIVNQLAVRLPELDAAVPFYGRQPSADAVPKIKASLLLHYAGNDQGLNAGIPAYEAALKANGKAYALYVYGGTEHGFHNDTTPRYDEKAAKLAWQRTVDFLNRSLR